jgi:MFS family permease
VNARRLAYLGCALGVGAFAAFNNFTLSLWLAERTSSYLLIGLFGNTRSFEGAIVSPLAGAWSDRTWLGWLGRRRPFILVGGLASAALLALTPLAAALPSGPAWLGADLAALAPAAFAIFLFTLAFNTMDDIHKSLMADIAEGEARNRLAALRVLVEMIGQVGILAAGALLWQVTIPPSAFVVTGAVMAIGVFVTVIGVREPEPAVWREPVAAPALSLRTLRRDYRPAAVLCLVMFAYWTGVSAVLPLVSVYTRDILGATVGEAQLLPGILLLSTTAFAWPMGWLGSRYGKRRTLGAGLVVMALAGLAGLLITTKLEGALLFALAGVGNAAILVLTIPLLADLVPRQHMAAAAGLLAAAGSVAAPLASLGGGGLADAFGPRAIFGLMAATTVIALALVPGTREDSSARPVGCSSREGSG